MKLQAVFRSNMAMNTPYYLNDIKTIEVSKIREIPLPENRILLITHGGLDIIFLCRALSTIQVCLRIS